ncbi:MAG: T9SS type A sorting domain-containing protein, partial [Ginsengibacter sp.]
LWGLFKGKYRLDLKINALPAYGSSNVICDLKVERNIRFFWGLIGTGWVKTSDAQPRPSPSNLIPWDCVPGGTQSSSGRSGGFSQSGTVGGFSGENFENRTLWGWLLEGLSRPLISVTQSIDIPFNQDIFSFVPITSALDIQNPTLASFYQTHVFPVGGLSGSASSGYMAQNKFTGIINDQSATLYNANHTDFTVRNSQWIFNEMENNSQTYDCEDYCENSMSITGANEICSTAIYKVKGLFPGATVTWSATPSNMVVFDCDTCAQTTITRNGSANGQTTITANISGPCGNTNLTIPITVGVPNNPLSIYGIPDNYNSCKNSIFNVTGSGGFGNSVWTVEGGQIISGQGTSEIYIQLDNTPGNGFYIGLFESNACGLSSVLATKQGNILDCDGGGGTTTRISPNPTNGQLTVAVTDVKTTRNSIKAIIVRNKMGRIFTKMEFPKGVTQHTFNIRNLPNDLYLIEIFDGKVWLEHKVILRN